MNGELDNVEAGIRDRYRDIETGRSVGGYQLPLPRSRLVKNLLREESKPIDENHSPTLRLITKRVRKPEASEIEANPRSRSAKDASGRTAVTGDDGRQSVRER